MFADLSTDDVNALTNVVREPLPDGVGIVDVLRNYAHCRYPAEKVFCCVCGTRQHRDGLHAVRSDGKEATVGMCCATRALGKKFVDAHRRYKGERERQGYLLTIHAFQPSALRIKHGHMTRAWDQLARNIREARYGLRNTLGSAWDVLVRSVNKGLPLTAPERVLVSKWTAAKETEREGDKTNDKDRYAWTVNDVGGVPGAAFFEGGDPVEIVGDLDRVLENFLTIAGETDAYSTGQLRQLVSLLRRGREGLERLLRMRRATDEVFSAENATWLVGWIDHNRSRHGHGFPHAITAAGGVFFNETMSRRARKPVFVEPSQEILGMLAQV